MVYGSIFNGPGFYPPGMPPSGFGGYGGGGYPMGVPPNAMPGMPPSGFGGYGGFGYGGSGYPMGYPPNAMPGLYPSSFVPPYPAMAGNMSPYRPYNGFFPAAYPESEHHATEDGNWNRSFDDYISKIGGAF